MSIYQNFCKETIDENGALVDFSLHYPENFNFGYDVVDAIAAQTPDKRAMVWCNTEGQEQTFTFADIRDQSNRMATVFYHAGIRRGDRVLVVLKRHYEYWFAAVALHKLGAVLIPATHMLTVSDLIYRIQAAQVKAVVCTAQNGFPEKVCAALAQTGREAKLWCVRGAHEGFEDLTAAMETASPRFDRVPTRAGDPMLMYFTSGTTGNPKGVVHDFSYPLAHIVTAKYWQQAEDGGLHFTVAETGWAKASWGKLYGQWLCESAVMVFDFDNFEPRQLCSVINRYGVTTFCAPPTVFRYLTRKGMPDMPTLRCAVTAGEKLHPEVSDKFTQKTGLVLAEGYGQTESGLLLANLAGDAPVIGSLGRPSPQYDVRIHRPDGTEAGPGEVGEIVVLPRDGKRPIGLFTGYLGDPERYRRVWEGGVYHTGDAGWRDEQGLFWFRSRADDLIKTGGFRVGPDEIEQVLITHPAVAECAVFGVPDPARGQAIKAVAVLNPGHPADRETEKAIREFCNRRLAEYKWIRVLEFVPSLPKTISGKICKAALRN